MAKRLEEEAICAEIERQTRRMGAQDFFDAQPECPFGVNSLAARHWREGFVEAERFPLIVLSEKHELQNIKNN